jgi:protein-S-isoprenylcysteine O-methyltransferase Ste14
MLPLVYVFTAIRYPEKEEPELIKLYGDTYREYQKRTGRFLPKFRRG